jgi:hypothetical protein
MEGLGYFAPMPERPADEESGPVTKLDVWALTSRRAYREFERKGKLDDVRRDIEENVLEGGDWEEADRQFLSEIRQLEEEGAVEEKASYWYCSPFPPTYRALKDGEILSRRFRRGQDIVYTPAKNVEREEKLIIGTFAPTQKTQMHEEHRTMKMHKNP